MKRNRFDILLIETWENLKIMQNDQPESRAAVPEQRVINYRPERPGLEFQREDTPIAVIAPVLTRNAEVLAAAVAPEPVSAPLSADFINVVPVVRSDAEVAPTVGGAPIVAVPATVGVDATAGQPVVSTGKKKPFTLGKAILVFFLIASLAAAAYIAYSFVVSQ